MEKEMIKNSKLPQNKDLWEFLFIKMNIFGLF